MRSLRQLMLPVLILVLSIAAGLLTYRYVDTPPPASSDIVLPFDAHAPLRVTIKSKLKVRDTQHPSNAVLCLAQNLYFEARNEPFAALEAVAATVFNRMELPHYPSTVCGVVYQHRQYSWTLEYSRWSVKPPLKFVKMSQQFLVNRDDIQTAHPVTHFHHVGISPKWAPRMTVVSKIGAHIFYRM